MLEEALQPRTTDPSCTEKPPETVAMLELVLDEAVQFFTVEFGEREKPKSTVLLTALQSLKMDPFPILNALLAMALLLVTEQFRSVEPKPATMMLFNPELLTTVQSVITDPLPLRMALPLLSAKLHDLMIAPFPTTMPARSQP